MFVGGGEAVGGDNAAKAVRQDLLEIQFVQPLESFLVRRHGGLHLPVPSRSSPPYVSGGGRA
jgi:hypothetical protein